MIAKASIELGLGLWLGLWLGLGLGLGLGLWLANFPALDLISRTVAILRSVCIVTSVSLYKYTFPAITYVVSVGGAWLQIVTDSTIIM